MEIRQNVNKNRHGKIFEKIDKKWILCNNLFRSLGSAEQSFAQVYITGKGDIGD